MISSNKEKTHNLLIWTSSFLPITGGLQKSSYEYVKYLNNNYNVEVITNRYPYDLKKNEVISGIKTHRYLFLHSPLNYFKKKRFDLFIAWFFLKPYTIFRLFFYLLKFRPKIINVHFPDIQLFECLLFKYIFKYKIILSFHGNEVERLISNKKWSIKNLMYLKIIKISSFITGCSNFILKDLKQYFPKVSSEKFIPVYNGVDNYILNQPLSINKESYFFSAARFIPKKGIDLLFELSSLFNHKKVFLAGGKEKNILKLNLTAPKNVEILGIIDYKSISNYLSNSYLTLITSKLEPYGIFVAEAICSGSPLVSSNVGGIPEIISLAKKKLTINEKEIFNEWIKIVPPDIKSFQSAIKLIINNNRSSFNEFLLIIKKIRMKFSWNNRLKKFGEKVSKL